MSTGDLLGWVSSTILVITLFVQVRKQWHDDTSRGVSPMLFVGQLAASIGFLVYAVQIDNYVFIVTNSLTTIAALMGLWITRRHQRRRDQPSKRSVVQRAEHA
jgi:MtN3 and saliva related transmembrane protein